MYLPFYEGLVNTRMCDVLPYLILVSIDPIILRAKYPSYRDE